MLGMAIGAAAAMPLSRLLDAETIEAPPAVVPIPDRWETEPDLTPHGPMFDAERDTFGWDMDSCAFEMAQELCEYWGWRNGECLSDGEMIP